MKTISNYQKAKIALQIINNIKSLENKSMFYFHNYDNEKLDLKVKIAKRSGIPISNYTEEAGIIDIDEYISLTFDEMTEQLERKLNPRPARQYNHNIKMFPEFKVSEELKQLTKKFEEENIPSSGPCKTLIGELFRAIQRIQYRAHNDGDMWFIIGSESFMSYMFLISQIDQLNWSSHNWNEKTGEHKWEFTDLFLKEHSWGNHISYMIEHSLGLDAEFIKYQLMDLLSNNKIKDIPNEWDSRDYTPLKKEQYY